MALHFIKVIYQPLYTVVNTDTRALPLLQQPFQTRFLLRYIPAQRAADKRSPIYLRLA